MGADTEVEGVVVVQDLELGVLGGWVSLRGLPLHEFPGPLDLFPAGFVQNAVDDRRGVAAMDRVIDTRRVDVLRGRRRYEERSKGEHRSPRGRISHVEDCPEYRDAAGSVSSGSTKSPAGEFQAKIST